MLAKTSQELQFWDRLAHIVEDASVAFCKVLGSQDLAFLDDLVIIPRFPDKFLLAVREINICQHSHLDVSVLRSINSFFKAKLRNLNESKRLYERHLPVRFLFIPYMLHLFSKEELTFVLATVVIPERTNRVLVEDVLLGECGCANVIHLHPCLVIFRGRGIALLMAEYVRPYLLSASRYVINLSSKFTVEWRHVRFGKFKLHLEVIVIKQIGQVFIQ